MNMSIVRNSYEVAMLAYFERGLNRYRDNCINYTVTYVGNAGKPVVKISSKLLTIAKHDTCQTST